MNGDLNNLWNGDGWGSGRDLGRGHGAGKRVTQGPVACRGGEESPNPSEDFMRLEIKEKMN